MLRLHTFGGCFLERDGAPLETASAYRKALALLAIVAAAGERGISRDSVVALLWPDSDDERARTALRQLVHALRNQLDAQDLIGSAAELRLNAAVPSCSVSLRKGPCFDCTQFGGVSAGVTRERASRARSPARGHSVSCALCSPIRQWSVVPAANPRELVDVHVQVLEPSRHVGWNERPRAAVAADFTRAVDLCDDVDLPAGAAAAEEHW